MWTTCVRAGAADLCFDQRHTDHFIRTVWADLYGTNLLQATLAIPELYTAPTPRLPSIIGWDLFHYGSAIIADEPRTFTLALPTHLFRTLYLAPFARVYNDRLPPYAGNFSIARVGSRQRRTGRSKTAADLTVLLQKPAETARTTPAYHGQLPAL